MQRHKPTDRDLLSHAFDLRRAWNETAPLNKADVLVLGLLVQLAGASTLLTGESETATRLTSACEEAEFPAMRLAVLGEPASGEQTPAGTIWLGPLATTPPESITLALFHGLREGIPAKGVQHDRLRRFLPLACRAPALWQCGLVWADAADGRSDEILNDLSRLFTGEWLDPLRLFEAAQASETRAPMAARSAQSDDPRAEIDALQARVRELEQTGLVRHELEVAKAVAREKRRL